MIRRKTIGTILVLMPLFLLAPGFVYSQDYGAIEAAMARDEKLFRQLVVKELSATSKLIEEGSHPEGYNVYKAFDGRSDTAWVEGKPDAGIGERVTIRFYSDTMIDFIDFQPGLFNSQYHKANNRVKKLLVIYGDGRGEYFSFTFDDTMTTQQKSIGGVTTDALIFEIQDVYPGSQWNDTCISEISIRDQFGGLKELVITTKEEKNDARLLDQLKQAIESGNSSLAKTLIQMVHNLDIDLIIAQRERQGMGGYGEIPDAPSALTLAIEKNMNDVVELLIDAGVDLDRALLSAVEEGRTEEVSFLLDKGANPTYGLHRAFRNGDHKMVELLLNAGANPDEDEILLDAVENDDPRMVELLLKAGADPNIWDYRDTVDGTHYWNLLMMSKSMQVAQLLIDYGADVNAITDRGIPSIIGPIGTVNINLAKIMLEAGADPESWWYFVSAMNPAAMMGYQLPTYIDSWEEQDEWYEWVRSDNGREQVVQLEKMFLHAIRNKRSDGIFKDKNALDTLRPELLALAAFWGRADFVENALIEGYDVNAVSKLPDQFFPDDFFHEVEKKLQYTGPDASEYTDFTRSAWTINKALLASMTHGGSPYGYFTLFSWAVIWGYHDIMRLVLDYGFNVDTVNEDGLTPLGVAVIANDIEAAKMLIDAGADIDKGSPLVHAVLFRRWEMVDFLLDQGADPGIRAEPIRRFNNAGFRFPQGKFSPLDAAVKEGYHEIVERLNP